MPYRTELEIQALVQAFESCTLSRQDWTHGAHLTVALWYLRRHAALVATDAIISGITQYNAASGIPSTPEGGYHETITRFWIHRVQQFLLGQPANLSLVQLANCLIEQCGHPGLLRQFYSRDRLASLEARTTWVEPDLQPLACLSNPCSKGNSSILVGKSVNLNCR